MGNNINYYRSFFPNWVIAGTTTKSFGDMKDTVNQNRLAEILEVDVASFVSLTQQHTNLIYDASRVNNHDIGDGLITDKRGIVLLVKTADCVPILMVEDKKKLIMVLHAGRIGLQKLIVDCSIREIIKKGGDVKKVKILLCPFIEKKCYDLDLESMVKEQLFRNNIEEHQIVSALKCTFCNNHEYFSYRRGNEERMATFIQII